MTWGSRLDNGAWFKINLGALGFYYHSLTLKLSTPTHMLNNDYTFTVYLNDLNPVKKKKMTLIFIVKGPTYLINSLH